MLSLQNHSCVDDLGPLSDDPLLIVPRAFPQQHIEFFPTGHLRYRHRMIPAKVPAFSFHATLLVAFARRTELGLKPPMRSEGDESHRVLSLVPAQNPFHCTREVVIAKLFKYAAKISEPPLVRFQKRPAGWHAERRNGKLRHWPCSACKTRGLFLSPRRCPHKLHTSPLALLAQR